MAETSTYETRERALQAAERLAATRREEPMSGEDLVGTAKAVETFLLGSE